MAIAGLCTISASGIPGSPGNSVVEWSHLFGRFDTLPHAVIDAHRCGVHASAMYAPHSCTLSPSSPRRVRLDRSAASQVSSRVIHDLAGPAASHLCQMPQYSRGGEGLVRTRSNDFKSQRVLPGLDSIALGTAARLALHARR